MKKIFECASCGKTPLEKDEISATKKFLGAGAMYCLACLAEITGFEINELEERIKQLKDDGCKFFK